MSKPRCSLSVTDLRCRVKSVTSPTGALAGLISPMTESASAGNGVLDAHRVDDCLVFQPVGDEPQLELHILPVIGRLQRALKLCVGGAPSTPVPSVFHYAAGIRRIQVAIEIASGDFHEIAQAARLLEVKRVIRGEPRFWC